MKNIKKLFAGLVVSALALGIISAYAAFEKTNTYTDGQFTDVPATEWYADSVKNAYEFGIMNGDSATTFNPEGTLTVAEGITISARIHANIGGKTVPAVQGGEWYQMYVDYAVANGIMTEDFFNSYDRNITRSEIALLFANVSGNLAEINSVTRLPDVPVDADYTSAVLKLYKAGILTGNDGYGTFAPSSNLLRSEISAMAVRIADESKRVKKTFPEFPAVNYSDAYYMIEAIGIAGRANGWNYDNRFEYQNTSGTTSTTASENDDIKFARLIRDFDKEDSGILRLEAVITAKSYDGGVYLAFVNEAEERIVSLCEKNGKWMLAGEAEAVSDIAVATDKDEKYAVIIDIDLDKNTACAIINNKPVSEISIKDSAVERLILGTNEKGGGKIGFSHVRLAKNYHVLEHFLVNDGQIGEKPYGWDINGDFALDRIESVYGDDVFSIKGTSGTAVKTFDALSGKICLETFILIPEKADGAAFNMMSDGASVLKIETKDGKLVSGNSVLGDYEANVWYCLHIETNPYTQTAVIKINGKEKATVPYNALYTNGVKLEAPAGNAVMWFDDVDICNINDHADYPEAPVVAESTDYNIGINMCYLWRDTQSGEGWDAVSPFEEFDTYLGFYDEGLRETADWELKWMAEHGIDFMHICWYSPAPTLTAPIKRMRVSYSALHDGYMNAKYSDLVDFCIMWENTAKFGGAKGLDAFKKYLWPYWMEYYFKDERYATLDNKAILTIWSRDTFVNDMGGEEKAREAVAFMEEELKKIGYDGIEILYSATSTKTRDVYEKIVSAGGGSTYGYHWSSQGYKPEVQINGNRANLKASEGISHHIPTVAIGYNGVGRYKTRYPIITVDDHLKVCEDIKDILSGMNTGTWQDNTLFLATWNEYSEGTYMAPTSSTGFDYLENVRKTFTNDTSDHSSLDIKLTEAQIDRVGHLYPANHAPIRRMLFEESVNENKTADTSKLIPVEGYSFDMSTEKGTSAFKHMFSIDGYSEEGGVISGTGKSGDFGITTENFTPIDASKIPTIHIRIKTEKASIAEIFFITEADKTWNYNKCKKSDTTVAGEYVDLYVDLSTVATYNSKVTALRIDPMTVQGSFEISLIEFMTLDTGDAENAPSVNVNGKDLFFDFPAEATEDGDIKVAAGPSFLSVLGLYHEWDRFTGSGVLTLLTKTDKKVVFTVGSSEAVVDGKTVNAGFTFTLRDGLPVFNVKKLCDLLGYPYTSDGAKLLIDSTGNKEIYDQLIYAAENMKWSFDSGESEGWKGQNGAVSVENGLLVLTPTTTDSSIINNARFNADDYTHLVFGIKNSEKIGSWYPQIFYTTQSAPKFNATNKINVSIDATGKGADETVEVYVPLHTSAGYRDVVTGLRLDPHTKLDTVEFDYIKLVKDKSRAATEKPAEEPKKEVVAPTLVKPVPGENPPQGIKVYAGGNATTSLTVGTDPEDESVKVYELKCIKEGQYTYLNIGMTFKAGATYSVSYKVYPLENMNGDNYGKTYIAPNFRYGTDGSSTANHTFGQHIKFASSDGWVDVKAESTIAEDYVPSGNDYFQIWGEPVGGVGINYLIKDIVIEMK